jgi:hypothetical protein
MSNPGASGSAPTVDLLEDRFKLSLLGTNPSKENIKTLLKNGLYYLTVYNAVSALVSFSSAATYVYSIQQSLPEGAARDALDPVLKSILGYVETLQEQTKGITSSSGGGGGSGKAGGKGGDKDEKKEDDWDVTCESFGCEENPKRNTSIYCISFNLPQFVYKVCKGCFAVWSSWYR